MYKVTLKIICLFCIGCRQVPEFDPIAYETELNRVTEARIDSAYKAINEHCDSLVLIKTQQYMDSIKNSGK